MGKNRSRSARAETETTCSMFATKVTIAFTVFASVATALRLPTPAGKSNIKAVATSPNFCYGLAGSMAPTVDFDPLNLLDGKDKKTVLKYREAELAHGRVAMVASLGFLVQESFHPLFGGAIDGAAIDSMPQIPGAFWSILPFFIAVTELKRAQYGWKDPRQGKENFMALRDDYTPGDLQFDPLGLKPTDPAAFREMENKELAHVRLAMLAAMGFIAQETVNHEPWIQNLNEMFN